MSTRSKECRRDTRYALQSDTVVDMRKDYDVSAATAHFVRQVLNELWMGAFSLSFVVGITDVVIFKLVRLSKQWRGDHRLVCY